MNCPDNSSFLKRAQKLTQMGIAIVPTYPGYRGAAFDDWNNQATTDINKISEWIEKGYFLSSKGVLHKVTPDHNWVCVAQSGGVGCLDIDNLEECQRIGMPALPEGVFITDTPSGGLHVPFVQTDDSRVLGNQRNVFEPNPANPKKPKKIFEFKGHNAAWCGPWQYREDGGCYKPRDSKAPIMGALPAEHIAWIAANSERHSEYKSKGTYKFHPTAFTTEVFLEHNYCSEDKSYNENGSLWIVVESCPLCGKDAKKTTGLGGVTKFVFGGNSYGFVCHGCSTSGKADFEEKMSDLYEDWEPWSDYIYEDDDPAFLVKGLDVEDADMDTCSPAAHATSIDQRAQDEGLDGHYLTPIPDLMDVGDTNDILCTDVGNGKRLARLCGYEIAYAKDSGTWYVWNGKIWQEDKGNIEVIRKAKSVANTIFIEASQADDKEEKENLINWALRSQSKERLIAMVWAAQSEGSVARLKTDFDTKEHLYTFNNGTVDLRTGELLPHDPRHYMTEMSPCNYLGLGKGSSSPVPRPAP